MDHSSDFFRSVNIYENSKKNSQRSRNQRNKKWINFVRTFSSIEASYLPTFQRKTAATFWMCVCIFFFQICQNSFPTFAFCSLLATRKNMTGLISIRQLDQVDSYHIFAFSVGPIRQSFCGVEFVKYDKTWFNESVSFVQVSKICQLWLLSITYIYVSVYPVGTQW